MRSIRIGVYVDGNYLSHVFRHYACEHVRRAPLCIEKLHEFFRVAAAACEQVDVEACQIVAKHFFRGQLPAKAMAARLAADPVERKFQAFVGQAGVDHHSQPVQFGPSGDIEERGIDVMLALEAYKGTLRERFDVVGLITGDVDFLPLVTKLQGLGTRVILMGWQIDRKNGRRIGVKPELWNAVDIPLPMAWMIDDPNFRKSSYIRDLFPAKALRFSRRPPRIVEFGKRSE